MTTPVSPTLRRFEFADLTLDAGRRSVTRGGEPLELSALNFDLLRVLVESWPNVVTYDELARRVWQRNFVSQENVAQRVLLLRQVLADDAAQPRYIEAVRTRGYRLLPPVETVEVDAPGVRRPSRLGWAVGSAAAAVAALLAAGFVLLRAPAAPPRLPSSVAVLPLENISPRPEDAYFAVGMHEEIIRRLAKFGGINVIAWTSVQRYAGTRKPIGEIAAELNVETVLEGSVRYADRRVRVTAALIDAATNAALWAEVYDRELADVFAVQQDIATNVAGALGAQLSTLQQRRQAAASPEAAALYLQVLDLQRRNALDNPVLELQRRNPLDSAVQLQHLDRALELDRGFAAAYAAKALVYALSLDEGEPSGAGALDEAEATRLALANADRAFELDSSSTEAFLATAVVHRFYWRWREALLAYAKAYEQSPLDVDAVSGYSALLSWTGRHDLAVELAERAAQLNPHSPPIQLGVVLATAGRAAEAAAVLRRAAREAPASAQIRHWLGIVEGLQGHPEAAAAELRETERIARGMWNATLLVGLAYSYSRVGRTADVDRLIAELERYAAQQPVGAGTRALALLAQNRPELALEQLRVAVESIEQGRPGRGFLNLLTIKTNVHRNPVLDEPRFQELRARLGAGD